MQPTEYPGIYKKNDRLFTVNPEGCKGIKVYNEQLFTEDNKEYRSWNPYRSKLAAAFLKGITLDIPTDTTILYLGAATGTTVSHLSDIVTKGALYAVESSPVAIINLLKVAEKRPNIIPILSDANHPERYQQMVPPVDLIYQDISQRNQADIFIRNIQAYLKPEGTALIMVKARSIDVALKPKQAYELVSSSLQKQKFKIKKTVELGPFEKDHATIIITR
ncbi:MAG TPA: fibrillarin-like rRNA/tRNA 2'-O-methyltransferase [Thermoplasmata archaeon]|jgi:fibrillarin-like pre-rRNA processing protein|nr:fibrillarin-like rRNA/tRNA 2'-O-methyltransferase [Thermoplasmata archaeon]HIH28175.1 fibrillarin-like rRNA/tRNA 2'-O-methyltransferase [Thermoplasmata archaeon]